MEAKFGILKKKIKNGWHHWRRIFQKNSLVTPFFDHKSKEEILEDLKIESVEEKLRRYKSKWLRHITIINSNRLPKIMLNYRPNGQRRL